MTPASHHSVSSLVPLDLNEDQNHEPFTPNHQLSSISSLSYPSLFNPPDGPDQDQEGSFYWERKHLPIDEKAEKIIPSTGSSWDHSVGAKMHERCSGLKLSVLKKEEIKDENLEAGVEDGSSVKWMPSKLRMMRKMMVSDQTASSYIAGNSVHNFEEQQQPLLSPLGGDNNTNSSNNYSNHGNITVRVCSDCQTTKTPLWRSGPRGPKSLCNACGIRQRKARRAAAMAAASATGTILVAAETSMKGNKLANKEKKSKIECAPQLKKKRKLGVGSKQSQVRNKELGVEDLTLRLSKNLALQQVFPQDEIKEAAILLMALSYGLVHG